MTPETHDVVLYISKTWGAVYLFSVFVLAALWTYWPSRKSTYDAAGQAPLNNEECLR
ncbi:Cbb3-type cytochrome oxidase, subunit 3 [Cognatishimia activa]|uniref:Cbb3-type cytochrome oxidase, subunit 3 n=1 Tax=Cognatishimia activa TaxID=1715691 RepID=A0A0P1IVK9_9RHOB|nr:cbb3-type cytochrome c oxidase subunit 3 [Cognatishimia activa]MEE2946084.1 cbb3-type cytochrome c oxidase subunit 3 [Pseudomonadota bacterium]CUK27517.1 Cbb3-type cytochrome oxidase, subunit 3 [Cognatishimia activa]